MYEEELRPGSSGEGDGEEGTYVAVIHLPRGISKDREHTNTVC